MEAASVVLRSVTSRNSLFLERSIAAPRSCAGSTISPCSTLRASPIRIASVTTTLRLRLFEEEDAGHRQTQQQRFDEARCLGMGPHELALEFRYVDITPVETLDQSIDRVVRTVAGDGVPERGGLLIIFRFRRVEYLFTAFDHSVSSLPRPRRGGPAGVCRRLVRCGGHGAEGLQGQARLFLFQGMRVHAGYRGVRAAGARDHRRMLRRE